MAVPKIRLTLRYKTYLTPRWIAHFHSRMIGGYPSKRSLRRQIARINATMPEHPNSIWMPQ